MPDRLKGLRLGPLAKFLLLALLVVLAAMSFMFSIAALFVVVFVGLLLWAYLAWRT